MGLKGTTNPGQSGPGSNSNKVMTLHPLSFRTGTSESYLDTSLQQQHPLRRLIGLMAYQPLMVI